MQETFVTAVLANISAEQEKHLMKLDDDAQLAILKILAAEEELTCLNLYPNWSDEWKECPLCGGPVVDGQPTHRWKQ